MSNYVAYFLSPSLALNGPIILVVAIALTVALRDHLVTAGRRLLFLGAMLSLGGVLQLTILRERPTGTCWECLTQWPLTRLISGQLGLDTALNVALFVPLGLFATLLWKRPFRVAGIAALISLAIEVTQPLLGSGANDLADLAANTFGALVGSGFAATILVVRGTIANRRVDVPRVTKLATAIALTIGVALGISIGGANAIQAAGARELNRMFAGTTLADHKHDEGAWASRIEAFWKGNRTPTNDAYSDDTVALQRFTWTYYWTTRCVTARWDARGFITEQANGNECSKLLH